MSSAGSSPGEPPSARLRLGACLLALLLVAAAGASAPVAAADDPTVSVEDRALGPDGTATINVSLSHAPEGLAGYAIEVTVADDTAATVADATPASLARTTTSVDGNTVTFIGADLDREVKAGSENVSLGSVTVAGEQNGTTAVTVTVTRIDTPDGERLAPRTDPGRVVVADSGSVTVAPDGSGAFESIQAAVDAVPAGYTVDVERGTYDEAVTVEKNLTVTGHGATLRGTDVDADAAVAIGPDAEPVLTGFTLRDWHTGVDATNTTGDWRLSAVTTDDVAVGLNAGSTRTTVGPAPPATGNWTVANLTTRDPAAFGIIAEASTGDWTVTRSDVRGGMYVAGAAGDWAVTDGTVSNDPDASVGALGIQAASTTGDWTVRNVTVENAATAGVWASGSSGNWTLRNATVKNVVRRADPPSAGYAGVSAFGASGDWRVVDSRVVATGGAGISARQTDGNWSVTGTAIAANDGPGVSVVGSDGAGSVADSAFVRNDGPDIDASGSTAAVDASGNWWADSSDGRCLGATCDAPLDDPPVDVPETLVVDADGSGEYDSIAAAAENATHGDRILVENGTYEDPITVDTSVDIKAVNHGGVTVDASGTAAEAGIAFDPAVPSGSTIDGLVVNGFQTGVDAAGDNGAWTLRNTTIRNAEVGVDATESSGGWAVAGSTITDTGTAVDVRDGGTAALPIRVRTSRIVNNTDAGVNAVGADTTVDATRNWWGQPDGPTDGQCVGNVDCDAQLLDADGDGVSITVAPDGTADYRTIGGAIAAATENDRIVVANGTYEERITINKSVDVVAATPGGVVIEDPGNYGPVVRIRNDASPTIDGVRIDGLRTGNVSAAVAFSAPGTSGEWTLRNVTVSDADVGVSAARSTGDWTVEESRFSEIVFNGIDATASSGDWTVAETTVQNGRSPASDGITATGATGNWTVRDALVADQGSAGIAASDADGAPRVVGSVVRDNGATGVEAAGSAGLTVRRTAVVDNNGTGLDLRNATGEHVVDGSVVSGNAAAGVDATDASATADATGNWWGREPGPDAGQCVGNADCSDALSDAPSISGPDSGADIVVAPDGSGAFESIQNAVDAAADGDTIRVRSGSYTYERGEQPVTVEKNVTIVGDGDVILEGPGLDSSPAITVAGGAEPVIESISIRAFGIGVDATETDGDWTLRNVSVEQVDAGVAATNATGAWTVTESTFENAAAGVVASRTNGDWRIEKSRIVDNERGVVARDVSAGSVRIANSTVADNTRVGVNATNSAVTVDATGNWWGQPDGPTDGQCVGNVDCGEPVSTPPAVDVRVAADGSGEFDSIRSAIEAASDGATIRVASGTYDETRIELDKNVTISGEPGATVVGDGPDAGEITTNPAFVVPGDLDDPVAPTVEGLALRDHVTGFQFSGSSGDWVVRDVTLENTRLAISASRTEGEWVVENVSHDPPETHIFAQGIDADRSTGDWRVSRFETARVNASVDARGATGDWTVSNGSFVDTGIGVYAESATGQWRIRRTSVESSREYSFSGETTGIYAAETTAAWRIANTTVEGAEAAVDLTPRYPRFDDPASGNLTIAESKLVENEVAIRANGVNGSWVVTRSTIADNAIGIDATDANRTGDATDNWWGQPSGPEKSQCVGNVDCSAPLSEPSGGDTERITTPLAILPRTDRADPAAASPDRARTHRADPFLPGR